MAGIAVDVSVSGLREAVRDFESASGRSADFRNAFHEVDAKVAAMFRRRFDTEGRTPADGDGQWKPLSPVTVARRESRSGGNRGGILWDFGPLRASLVKMSTESIRVIESHRYERGTSRRGAFAHQEGKGVPKREIIPDPMPASFVDGIAAILIQHVEEGFA